MWLSTGTLLWLADGGTDTVAGLPVPAAVVVALIGALGLGGLLARTVERHNRKTDARADNDASVADINAQAGADVLRELLQQMNLRIDGYRQSIEELRLQHSQDIANLRHENQVLTRRVEDLSATVQNYELGRKVPRGMVLVPVQQIRAIRASNPGLLMSMWYPGEDDVQTSGPVSEHPAGP